VKDLIEIKNQYANLKSDFIEMAQLKSDFDIDKLTAKRSGNFIAHNFHFIMRQYSLALYELRRMVIEKTEKERIIQEHQYRLKKGDDKVLIWTDKGREEKYIDLEIEKLKNEIDLLDLSMQNKFKMCEGFEKAREKLIKQNGGASPTNEQYQREDPECVKILLQQKAIYQNKERNTGVKEGVWENIDYLEQPALLDENFQVKMLDGLGNLDLGRCMIENEKMKGYPERIKKLTQG